MQIQIRHDANVGGDKHRWIATTVQGALARFGAHVTTVEVHLADEDGPKNSDGAIRCSIEARTAGFLPVAATAHGNDVGMAVAMALDKIEHLLDRMLGRARDHHARVS
jgi:ribosome-associated translation inhibitor RaiA